MREGSSGTPSLRIWGTKVRRGSPGAPHSESLGKKLERGSWGTPNPGILRVRVKDGSPGAPNSGSFVKSEPMGPHRSPSLVKRKKGTTATPNSAALSGLGVRREVPRARHPVRLG